jgi:hypothetical protein
MNNMPADGLGSETSHPIDIINQSITVSELWLLTSLLYIPQIYEYEESHSGMILKGKTKELREKPVSCHFAHHKLDKN